jgi:RimJ/RimL family protein N-acetyltransferase
VRLADGKVVGATRLMSIERWAWPEGNANARPVDAVEIGGTWLAASAQRSPINTEAKYLQLCHAFEVWRVHRLVLITDERNARSRAAIERIGGQLEVIHRNHRPASDGTIRSSAVFTILEADWPRVKERLEARLRADR